MLPVTRQTGRLQVCCSRAVVQQWRTSGHRQWRAVKGGRREVWKLRTKVDFSSADHWRRRAVQTSPQVTWSHPPGGRLPLLSARPAVTFRAIERHRPSARNQIILLGDRGTCVWADCPRMLPENGPAEIRTRDLLDRGAIALPLSHTGHTACLRVLVDLQPSHVLR